MTEKQKQTKLIKLKAKLESLEERYRQADREETEKLNRRGWGYGMRHAKIGFSTRKTDHLKERIKNVKAQISELEA